MKYGDVFALPQVENILPYSLSCQISIAETYKEKSQSFVRTSQARLCWGRPAIVRRCGCPFWSGLRVSTLCVNTCLLLLLFFRLLFLLTHRSNHLPRDSSFPHRRPRSKSLTSTSWPRSSAPAAASPPRSRRMTRRSESAQNCATMDCRPVPVWRKSGKALTSSR